MKAGSKGIARAVFRMGLPVALVAILCVVAWPTTLARAQDQDGGQTLVQELRHDVSPPLRDIEPKIPPRGPAHAIPLLHPPRQAGPGGLYADPAQQTTLGPSVSTTTGLGFDGVGDGFTGPDGTYNVGVAPPDTNGAVGATQYVQWVNLAFAVFDKTDGTVLKGPMAGNTLWSGFGGACEQTNDGDVIAQYDKAANRWVMAQLSYSQAPPYLLCVAVSTSSDATGTYNRYELSYSGNLNDYPKIGVWPDGYYVTANMFKPRTVLGIPISYRYQGPEVCALDRAKMLNGDPATAVCRTLSSSYASLLPADLDGSNPPPAESPNYLLGLGGSSSLYLWKFKPDFTNGTSTLNGPTSISVSSYNDACGGGACIPQSGTNQQLDSLGERLMYRLAYRNLGGTEILLANHSVATTVGGSSTVGIRWYEIHDPNGTPTVYQQSTWAPDATYRWMGSIAMDQAGNIALGYSASSGSIHPAIRYTGREAGDTLNTMQSENSIIEGTGSQTQGLDRWGDYSAMSIDPTDDCTFWYTTEYLQNNGTFNWNTRIASFKFDSCPGGSSSTSSFSLSPTPTSTTVTAGTTGTSYTIEVSAGTGYSGLVDLSVESGCPDSASNCSITPGQVDLGSANPSTATLTVDTSTSTTAQNYNIAVKGTDHSDTGLTSQTSVQLSVTDFSLSPSPSSQTVTQGTDANYTITVGSLNGFGGTVSLDVSGCPSGASCNLPSSVDVPAAGSTDATLTVTTDSLTVSTTYPGITVNASDGGTLNHSTSVSLTVDPPAAGDFSINASPGNVTLKTGQMGSYTVAITPSNGFNSDVTVTANCPSGFSCGFSNGGIVPGGNGSVTYSVTNDSAPKRTNETVTFDASGGGQSHSTSVGLKAR